MWIFKIKCFNPLRILDEHWCIYSCLQIPPRENWFQYVRRLLQQQLTFLALVPCSVPSIEYSNLLCVCVCLCVINLKSADRVMSVASYQGHLIYIDQGNILLTGAKGVQPFLQHNRGGGEVNLCPLFPPFPNK